MEMENGTRRDDDDGYPQPVPAPQKKEHNAQSAH